MSEVYLAEQVSLGRRVALKVLKRDLNSRADMAERFRREALLLSTVDHPAVVRVIDFEPANEANVLVLELAEGQTLETVLKAGPLAPERAIVLLAQLAEGLGAIHEKGIVHRDLKPQNVVITPNPRGGEQARLLDFGIARLMELSHGPSPGIPMDLLGPEGNPFVSQPGQVVGTPAFVSPEQATARPFSTRSDVYAFGVLAFRVLSGSYPLPGPGSRDFLVQHVTMAPRKLDEVAPHLARHPELVALVMQCLEKEPDKRPRDGHALFEALARLAPAAAALESGVTTPSRRLAAAVAAAEEQAQGPSTLERLLPTLSAWARKAAFPFKVAWVGLRLLEPDMKRSLLVALGILAMAPAVWALLPPGPAERAAQLIAQGRASEALEVVTRALPEKPGHVPELLALKAAALHRLNRLEEEREVLRVHTYQALHAAHPLLLEALAEDYATTESDAELKDLLAVVPDRALRPAFEAFATGPRGRKQWGALRYLDYAGKHQRLDRVDLYSAALGDSDCGVRARAALRLSELKDDDAIPALRQLSETPKEESVTGRLNCGQDEAAEAIRQLRRALGN